MTVNHPIYGTMCCICFTGLTEDMCAVDSKGQKWDVCKGKCWEMAWKEEDNVLEP